jgi:hypothetical protein
MSNGKLFVIRYRLFDRFEEGEQEWRNGKD